MSTKIIIIYQFSMFKSLDSIASVVGIVMYLTISKFKQVLRSRKSPRLQHWLLTNRMCRAKYQISSSDLADNIINRLISHEKDHFFEGCNSSQHFPNITACFYEKPLEDNIWYLIDTPMYPPSPTETPGKPEKREAYLGLKNICAQPTSYVCVGLAAI